MSILERVYFFHEQLRRSRYPNARTLMAEFEISLPTARRDIAYLRDRLQAPLAFDHGRNGFYYTEDEFSLPFANSPRIAFLLGMLGRLAEETGLGELPEIRQLEQRLAAMVGRQHQHIAASIHCEWVEVEHPDAAVFDAIIEAIVGRRRLEISYRSPGGEPTERAVEPRKLINYQGRWYLSAWCLLRDAHRTFHVARIATAEPGAPVAADRSLAAGELDRSFGIFKGPPRYTARVLFTGTAAELVKNQTWHEDQTIEETADGIVLSLPVHDDREIMMKVLQYGAQAQVVGPGELIGRIREETRQVARLYDG